MAGKQQKSTGTKKKTNARRKTTTKKKNNSRKKTETRVELTQEELEQQAGIRNEVLLVTILAVSVLLVLSNFNLCGSIGQMISGITFGLFGFMGYFFPLILFLGIAFMMANRKNRVAKIKMTAAGIAYLLFIVLCHMFTEPLDEKISVLTAYSRSSLNHNGGGLIGGVVVGFLHPLLGTVGCYVLIIALLAICLVLITQRSIFIPLSKRGHDVYSKASEQHRKQARMRKEEREQQRKAKAEVHIGSFEAMPDEELKEKTQEPRKKTLNFDLKKPLVEDIKEEIILPREPEEKLKEERKEVSEEIGEEIQEFTVNRMEPLAVDFDDIDMDFGVTEEPLEDTMTAQMRPIQIPKDIETEDMEPEIITKPKRAAKEFTPVAPSESAVAKASAKAEAMKTATVSEEEKQMTAEQIETALEQKPEYVFPPLSLLVHGERNKNVRSDDELRQTALKLKNTLDSFGVKVQVNNVTCGPSVTRYELQPEQGVKVSRIVNLSDDIKLNLAVADIRIEAPIPGKAAIGIEVPNKENTAVMLRDLLESKEFRTTTSSIAFAAGRDIGGKVVLADIAKMPHLLIAGATGSGKSVCINTLIMSVIYKSKPEDVRLIMIDPKVVELSVYNGIPHLLIPVVTDPKKAAGALNWAVMEMTDRYKKFAELHVRDLKGYNEKVTQPDMQSPDYPKLPQIVIIVDELADLMMVAPGEVEDAICRLAQLARACGIHLVIATQRPSVNVITGVIKANIPSRIAFSVSSSVDSRTIIDMGGAEKLLGKGDMLFYPSGYQKPLRVQGAFVSDEEVNAVVEFLRESQNGQVNYNDAITSQISNAGPSAAAGNSERDVYFVDAGKFIIEKDKASIGMLQRVFKIGFNRAARIMDQLYEAGVVGPEEGTKPRKVIMSLEEFEAYIEEYV